MAALALALAPSVRAQVTPLWDIHFGVNQPAALVRGSFYNNTNLFGSVAQVTQTPTINFLWGAGSPGPGVFANQFSARFTGTIVPPQIGNYTFAAITDDGVRVYLDDVLIINAWFDQGPTRRASAPQFLQGGTVYNIRVEYYENTGDATLQLFWSAPGFSERLVTFQSSPDGTEARFGSQIAALGNGRIAVSAPENDILRSFVFNTYYRDAGSAFIYDVNGQSPGFYSAPGSDLRRRFGESLAAFPDGRLLVGTFDSATNNVGTVFNYVGSVHLHDANGALLRTWPNPEGPTSQNTLFGYRLATLSNDRFAATLSSGFGKVMIFDAGAVGNPLVVITNPTPVHGEQFGQSVAAFGANRLLIGDHTDSVVAGRRGSVMIYDLNGTRLNTIPSPTTADPWTDADTLGSAIVAVDQNRFLVSAPNAKVRYLAGGQLTTNHFAGAVYMYDSAGALLKTFIAPDVARSQYFGTSLAMLGPGRILIGCASERVNGISAGRVHIYNLDGLHLESVDNPAPADFDRFGHVVAAIDERRFVVGAPNDKTRKNDAGSIYAYDAPIPEVELGSRINPPNGVDASGTFPSQGPAITPAGAAFWHVPSGRLFAVKPGGIRVSWPLVNSQTYNWEGSVIWPTNQSRYQVHVAGQAPVDLGGAGQFTDVVLQATTTDANASEASQQRRFSATTPGQSLVMLSSGSPASNPIRFQLIKSILWNDPAHLHDNAPATIGSPIVDPGNYLDPAAGPPQIVLSAAVFAPPPVFDPATRIGTIIPVNRDDPGRTDDDPVVA
ncbi:MAG TPA: hypothetical protein DCY13_10375, partial [Verrucomicrobiales bacterium]|nr:hypothetical protein [Verrucomicrobiales bacterium]